MALKAGEGHLRDLELEPLADQLIDILARCDEELTDIVPDAVPGILMDRDE